MLIYITQKVDATKIEFPILFVRLLPFVSSLMQMNSSLKQKSNVYSNTVIIFVLFFFEVLYYIIDGGSSVYDIQLDSYVRNGSYYNYYEERRKERRD